MTVKELTEILSQMPQDATVRIKHELADNEQFVERLELMQDGSVWIYETFG